MDAVELADGSLLSICNDGVIRRWNTNSGELLETIELARLLADDFGLGACAELGNGVIAIATFDRRVILCSRIWQVLGSVRLHSDVECLQPYERNRLLIGLENGALVMIASLENKEEDKSNLFDRQVKQLKPEPNKAKPKTLYSEHLAAANLVLLGDPGAGKSHLFEQFCAFENGIAVTARNFTKYGKEKYHQQVVYIDGLDEQRSQSESLIDDIVSKLLEVEPTKVRIACRAADWLGETDLALFAPYFEQTKTKTATVLALEKLTDNEIEQILSSKITGSTKAFTTQAKNRGVYPLLNNPQTLLMLADTVEEGIWPATKTQLFAKATQLMVVEKNATHSKLKQRQSNHHHSKEQLLQQAGAICAHLLIANVQGISTNSDSDNNHFPFYGDILSKLDAAERVLSSRLFTATFAAGGEDEAVQYSHRTIAEYLGALWLKERLEGRLQQGLSLTRLLAMLGYEGYPTAELKGLFAWLATLSHQHTARLIDKDPLAILHYGDVASLSVANRLTLLTELEKLAKDNRWFNRDDNGNNNEQLGTLFSVELVPKFVELLTAPVRNCNLRMLVLNAIVNGPELPAFEPALEPDLKRVLFAVLLDANAAPAERHQAFDAIANAIPDGAEKIVESYKSKHCLGDNSRTLRARALSSFYSQGFTPADIIAFCHYYLEAADPYTVGELWLFSNVFPKNELPQILDGLSDMAVTIAGNDSGSCNKHGARELNSCFAQLLFERVSYQMPEIAKLYYWLGSLSKFASWYQGSESSDNRPMTQWLRQSQDTIVQLFNYKLQQQTNASYGWLWHWSFGFEKMVLYCIDEKSIDGKSFIDTIAGHCINGDYAEPLSHAVFEFCLTKSIQIGVESSAIFGKMLACAADKPQYQPIVERHNHSSIVGRTTQKTRRAIDEQKQDAADSSEAAMIFQADRHFIESGQDFSRLQWATRVYFNLNGHTTSANVNGAVERLENSLGKEGATIAITGLIAYLFWKNTPSLNDIADDNLTDGIPMDCYVVLAGMEESWQQNTPIADYPDALITRVLALACICTTSAYQNRPWARVLRVNKPALAITAYRAIVLKELADKKNHLKGLF